MIITLCGSLKFESLFHDWNERLTLEGYIVISVAVYPSQKSNDKGWYTESEKQILDLVHLAKIDASDAIVVLNKDDYIGFSTQREIDWADMRGKEIYYLEGDKRPMIADSLLSG